MKKAIFIDKDGTLIPDIPYNADPELVTLQNNMVDGLKLLQDEGYLLFIVSNQAGIAHGYFEEEELSAVAQKINTLLGAHHIYLSGFYYCPHHPTGKVERYAVKCNCRKPLPGMLLQAAKENNIDLSQSWMVGDILNDVEAGNRAGSRTVLLNNGNETEWIYGKYRQPAYTCKTINEAAYYIHQKQLA